MRKLAMVLFTSIGLLLSLGLPLSAPAQAAPSDFLGTYYLCDGNGSGYCMSLVPFAVPLNLEQLFAIAKNGGAWRWDVYRHVSGNGTIYITFVLHADTNFCAGNSGGSAYIKTCDGSASETWQYYPNEEYANVGRTNDQGTKEVLCNPGGGNQLVIVKPGSCTSYHEQWGLVS